MNKRQKISEEKFGTKFNYEKLFIIGSFYKHKVYRTYEHERDKKVIQHNEYTM